MNSCWWKLYLGILFLCCVNSQNIATQFGLINLQFVRETPGALPPPSVARLLAILTTCMYDAYTLFDPAAMPTYNTTIPKMITSSSSDMQKVVAFSAFRALADQWAESLNQTTELYQFMVSLGYDPAEADLDTRTLAGIGTTICTNILNIRLNDGMNQRGGDPRTFKPNPFADTGNYFAVNSAQGTPGKTNCSVEIRSINHWQPLKVPQLFGPAKTQSFAVPHMCNVLPYALQSSSEFRPAGPPLFGTSTQQQLIDQMMQLVNISGQLTDLEKSIADYWAGGLGTNTPPGQWHNLAIEAAIIKNLSLSDTIKLLYLQSNAAFDAGIAAWDAKRYFDAVRPITFIQCQFANLTGTAWLGAFQGVGQISLSQWAPYQDPFFITPPFAAYISGHSTFSAASAEVLKSFFGSDTFIGNPGVIAAGSNSFEPMITNIYDPRYRANVTDVPNKGPTTIGYVPAQNLTLTWATWTEVANQCGQSRLYGGIHISQDNIDGLAVGRLVGAKVYAKASALFQAIPPSNTTTVSSASFLNISIATLVFLSFLSLL